MSFPASNGVLQKKFVNNELLLNVSILESFVCEVYYSTGSRTIPSLRCVVFRTRNLEGEMLHPIHAALPSHITCANYITMRDKWYVTSQSTAATH